MPTLDWIGKQAVVNHDQEVPFRLLHCDNKLSAGNPDSGNLIVQGDNLNALKALLPYYAGKVKCIYIDPPYNTGNEGWVYNDNVNAPEMKAWFETVLGERRGKIVGKEGEDLSRHDKWLCMMYPRLKLLHQFLREDGVLLVSLDDTELANLRLILDELFGKSCFIGTFAWNTRNTDNRVKSFFSNDHEYIVVYGKSPDGAILGRVIDRSNFKNPDNDPRGPYVTDPLTGKATASERPNLHAYNMVQPGTNNIWKPEQAKGWITDEAGYKKLLEEDRIWWPPNPATGKPRKKRFLSEVQHRMPASSFWPEFRAQSGAKELDDILDERVFAFPKPISLLKKVIDHCLPEDGLILDSFAGSGTTMHAVMQLNREDGGNRRCIMVEMEEKIATEVTAERIRRVMKQEGAREDEGFRYCRLGEPLFAADGTIREQVKYRDLAHHIFFTETGRPLPKSTRGPKLGEDGERTIYLLFNGILGDKSVDGGNILTRKTLDACAPGRAGVQSSGGARVIYGEGCRLSPATLRRLGITFKQLPYDVKVS